MPTEKINQPPFPNPIALNTAPRSRWERPLAVAAVVAFFLSSAFPVVAGFVRDTESWPKWWGVLDVNIAFVVAILAFAIMALSHGRVNKQVEDPSYRAYRILIHGIFAMLVIFFLFADRIVWENCLTGIAWRFWLLPYGLPAWFAVFGATAALSWSIERPAAT